MASFTHTLRIYRNGDLSLEQLLSEVDNVLADERADAHWLLAKLNEENTQQPLPPDVHDAVKQKLEYAVGSDGSPLEAATEPPLNPVGQVGETGTRLAPVYRPDDKISVTASSESANSAWSDTDDDAHIKGTGDVLNGRFELQECLGSGGMSTVYKALDQRKLEAEDRNPYVAVKVLNMEFRAHPDSLIALQREAKKCQSLAHPNIVRVYDFDRDGDTVFMTMEYLSGQPLGRIIGAPGFKGMPPAEGLSIINDIGKALSFAHDFGFVHADFKPANVIITDKGQVKVIDFGIARAFQRPDDTAMEATRFDPGSLGAMTPMYASPEMLEHLEPDPRDDIYALACTAYEILTGRHPFGRTSATAARDGGLQLKRHEAFSNSQFKAIKNALEFQREKRTATVTQFLGQIQAPHASIFANKLTFAASVLGFFLLLGTGLGYYFYSNHNLKIASTSPLENPPPRNQPPETVVAEPTPPPVQPVQTKQATSEAGITSINSLLVRFSCAAVQASLKDGAVSLTGYARNSDIPKMQNALMALDGISTVKTNIIEININACDVIQILAPYWKLNLDSGYGTSIGTSNTKQEFIEGQDLVLKLKSPSYDSYLNVDYFSLDDGVVHMVPSPRLRANQAPAKYNATIGDLGEWKVGAPFGRELIALIATSEPIFKTVRKEYEPKSKYLPDLKKRLDEMKRANKQISVDFVLVQTRPR